MIASQSMTSDLLSERLKPLEAALLPALGEVMGQMHRDDQPLTLLLSDLQYLYQWLVCLPAGPTLEQSLFLQALDDLKNSLDGIDPQDASHASVHRIWRSVLSSFDHCEALEHMMTSRPLSVAFLSSYDQIHDTKYAQELIGWLMDLLSPDACPQRLATLNDLMTDASTTTTPSAAVNLITADALNADTDLDQRHTAQALLEELDQLVGLEPVKAEVISLVNLLRINQMRIDRGFLALEVTKHMVFYGNPGTGKTTVARLVAKIFKALGLLKKGHLVETDRSGLVAAYVGQTALKVKKMVNMAQDGVLFIDEAYSLAKGENDFGSEAVDALLKLMEDRRDSLVVIVAGYTEKMKTFIHSNPGLKSRFTRFLEFPDYSAQELYLIFQKMVSDAGMQLSPEAANLARDALVNVYHAKDEHFGNARFARTCFEQCTMSQANRLAAYDTVSDEALNTIIEADIRKVLG